MKNNLIKLRNTLGLIETKNDSTKLMAQCLTFVEELIKKFDNEEKEEGEDNE